MWLVLPYFVTLKSQTKAAAALSLNTHTCIHTHTHSLSRSSSWMYSAQWQSAWSLLLKCISVLSLHSATKPFPSSQYHKLQWKTHIGFMKYVENTKFFLSCCDKLGMKHEITVLTLLSVGLVYSLDVQSLWYQNTVVLICLPLCIPALWGCSAESEDANVSVADLV